MQQIAISLLKPISALYEDKIEAGILLFPRGIVALTAPLDEHRDPVGPALFRGPVSWRHVATQRYTLITSAKPTFADCYVFRAEDDRAAIEIANRQLIALNRS